jgi:hypothetical protein
MEQERLEYLVKTGEIEFANENKLNSMKKE